MKRLYIDIDGVLLTKEGAPAPHLVEFLAYATENFDCYWLTTHCKGDAGPAIQHLSQTVPSEAMPFLEKIKPTNWTTLKTEALDFSQDFLWLDDYVLEFEKGILKKQGALDSLISIDLDSSPNQLLEFVEESKKSSEE